MSCCVPGEAQPEHLGLGGSTKVQDEVGINGTFVDLGGNGAGSLSGSNVCGNRRGSSGLGCSSRECLSLAAPGALSALQPCNGAPQIRPGASQKG